MPNLLERLNLFRKKILKPRPKLDAAVLRKSGEGWTRANRVERLLEFVKPMTDQEAAEAMEEALREAGEEVRWKMAAEEEEADATAQAEAGRAGPERAVEILAAAAAAKARRAEEAPAKWEAARTDAIRRANKARATREQQSENAAAAAKLVQEMSAGLEPDLPTLLQRTSALRKPKDIAASLKEIFKTIEAYKAKIEDLRERVELPRESHMHEETISSGTSEDGGNPSHAEDSELPDADFPGLEREQFIAILTDALSDAIHAIAKTTTDQARKVGLDLQEDFDRLYKLDSASVVRFGNDPVVAEEPDFLSTDPYSGQGAAVGGMTSGFAQSIERIRSFNASIAEIAAQSTLNVGEAVGEEPTSGPSTPRARGTG